MTVATGPAPEQLRALFDPRGVVVAGASSHPGKFGFVALHNILSQGYAGEVYATNREGGTILGIETVPSVDDLPAGAVVDLVFVCTPAGANLELLAACARRGITAAFITSAGYGEAGEAGRAAERELVDRATELGLVDRGTQRPGRDLDPVAALRADRGAVPAAGPDRCRQPVGQLRVVVPELLGADRDRDQPIGERRERGDAQRARLPRLLRP